MALGSIGLAIKGDYTLSVYLPHVLQHLPSIGNNHRHHKRKMASSEMLLQLIVSILLTASIPNTATQSIAVNRTGCQDQCGNVKIPFPFGTGTCCSLNHWYNISRNTYFTPPKPFLTSFSLEVTEINFQGEQTLSVISRQQLKSLQQYGPSVVNQSYELYQVTSFDMAGSPFLYSSMHNVFSVQGCIVDVLLLNRTRHHSWMCQHLLSLWLCTDQ
ncbi:hypothetical protein Ancab_000641 [Ancistrocladus abbreviatus]